MFKLGFTGTREMLTAAQIAQLGGEMLELEERAAAHAGVEAHSGDCIGADAIFWTLACYREWRTVGHLPVDDDLRAFCRYDDLRAPLTYFARNRKIAEGTDFLLAAPKQAEEQAAGTGGGTWYTIHYARKIGKPVRIIWPSGRVSGA